MQKQSSSRTFLVTLIHLNFIGGMAYAAARQIMVPRRVPEKMQERRLWAYEFWLIFGFYANFLSQQWRKSPPPRQ